MLLGFSRETEPIGNVNVCDFLFFIYKELAHAVRKTGESQDWQSASRRPRRASGVAPSAGGPLVTQEEPMFQFKAEGRKNPCLSLNAGGIPLYLGERDQPFVLRRPSTDQRRPIQSRGGSQFCCINLNVEVIQKYLITQNNV